MNKKEELLEEINKINLEIKKLKKEEYIQIKKNEIKSQKMFLYHRHCLFHPEHNKS